MSNLVGMVIFWFSWSPEIITQGRLKGLVIKWWMGGRRTQGKIPKGSTTDFRALFHTRNPGTENKV